MAHGCVVFKALHLQSTSRGFDQRPPHMGDQKGVRPVANVTLANLEGSSLEDI